MRKRKIIAAVVVLIAVMVGAVLLAPAPHVQVVGSLPPDDLAQIQKVVWKEIRFWVLPKLNWDDVYNPRYIPHYVFAGFRDYAKLHILWVDVKPNGSVEVFVGESKDTILSQGHAIDLQKKVRWEIIGYGYWGFSNAAPHDIHIPPITMTVMPNSPGPLLFGTFNATSRLLVYESGPKQNTLTET
jgi:hypothetical protein